MPVTGVRIPYGVFTIDIDMVPIGRGPTTMSLLLLAGAATGVDLLALIANLGPCSGWGDRA